jgi:hypothetical protein
MGKNYMPPDETTLAEASRWLEYAVADLALALVPLLVKSKYEMLLFRRTCSSR